MWNTEPKKGVPCWQKLLVAAEEESRFITICPLTIISIIFIIVLLTTAIGVTKSKECVNTLEITQIDFQPVFSKTDQSEQKKSSITQKYVRLFHSQVRLRDFAGLWRHFLYHRGVHTDTEWSRDVDVNTSWWQDVLWAAAPVFFWESKSSEPDQRVVYSAHV